MYKRQGYVVEETMILPDEAKALKAQLIRMADGRQVNLVPVSYTHLDVYKRQGQPHPVAGSTELAVHRCNKADAAPVSYTHLDVYKRQPQHRAVPERL